MKLSQYRIGGRCAWVLLWCRLVCVAIRGAEPPQGTVAFDFTEEAEARQWKALHDIAVMSATPDGLRIQIAGSDPYLSGPARDYPSGQLLWMHLRLRSQQGGTGQVFFFVDAPTEAHSVHFEAPAGEWHDVLVPMPALGAGYRLRIDPPGSKGTCELGRLWFERRLVYEAPAWPRPELPGIAPDALTVQSGDIRLTHNRSELGSFSVEVAGRSMAFGHARPMLGYVRTDQVRWVAINAALEEPPAAREIRDGFELRAAWRDPDAATWTLTQRYTVHPQGGVQVEGVLAVDQDRSLLYFPLWTLLPGLGSFGTNKNQALVAGVEYLENEPSSSEADLTGPASWRLVPDHLKWTFPLMAIQGRDRYLGLTWEEHPFVSAVFDSPDRQFHSGGHLMGLIFPGSNGSNREERSLLPYRPELLKPGQPLQFRATLIGGRGGTVIPAVQEYVRRTGLPSTPNPGYTAHQYFELAARGWLQSRIRLTNLFQHAWWPGFNPQPAADAALWMRWLAGQVPSQELSQRLGQASAEALAIVPPEQSDSVQIGHNRYPLPALVFGSVPENALAAKRRARSLLGRFSSDGSVVYQPAARGPDYARTHWSREANGLTAGVVSALLEAAAYAGDEALIQAALQQLQRMDKFRSGVPRGAQTWEIPLHTPDILAAAYLVRAYTLGYELSGNAEWLDQAKFWAWTGVPFVYLRAPTARPVGLFATIPVLGATAWVAPVWIGLPVQWCGLVYAEALYQLMRHDPTGPWQQLADGITASGIQQTWPATDPERLGLLPDIFQLRAQQRGGPAINPATLQAPALRFYRRASAYEFRALQRGKIRVHAPGALTDVSEQEDGLSVAVRPWSSPRAYLLINGVWDEPKVRLNGQDIELRSPHQYQQSEGWLILALDGAATVKLRLAR